MTLTGRHPFGSVSSTGTWHDSHGPKFRADLTLMRMSEPKVQIDVNASRHHGRKFLVCSPCPLDYSTLQLEGSLSVSCICMPTSPGHTLCSSSVDSKPPRLAAVPILNTLCNNIEPSKPNGRRTRKYDIPGVPKSWFGRFACLVNSGQSIKTRVLRLFACRTSCHLVRWHNVLQCVQT